MNSLPDGIKELEDDVYEIDSNEFIEEDSDISFTDEDRADSEDFNNFPWYFNSRKLLCSLHFHPHFPRPPHLAIGGCNDKLIIFSLQEGDKASNKEFKEKETVSAVRYSPDGKYLAYATLDGSITIFTPKEDINDYVTHARFEGPKSVEYIKWHKDKHLLLVLGTDSSVWCWYEGTVVVSISSSIPVSGVLFNHLSLALSCQDGSVSYWSNIITDDHCTSISSPEVTTCSSQSIEYCNGLLVVGQSNGKVFIVNPVKKTIEKVYFLHSESVENILYHPTIPKDKTIASSGMDGYIYLWNIDTGAKILQIKDTEDESGITRMIWHPNSYILIAGFSDGWVGVYNCNNGRALVKRRPHSGPVIDLSVKMISQTQTLIGSVGYDGSARIWMLKS